MFCRVSSTMARVSFFSIFRFFLPKGRSLRVRIYIYTLVSNNFSHPPSFKNLDKSFRFFYHLIYFHFFLSYVLESPYRYSSEYHKSFFRRRFGFPT